MGAVGRTFTIGELARRTAIPVKTIRFYSDEGLLPPTDRTHSGYRLYDTRSLARLKLIKTLRELGLGLHEVSKVLAEEATVPRLAARHVAALDAQISRLRLRRAVLRAVVKREAEPEEVKLMNKLASMSDEERARMLEEFWTEVTEGLTVDPEFYERMRSAKPVLPDDPTPEQVEAWVELAELIRDPGFRQVIRGVSERHSAALESGEDMRPNQAQQENWSRWSARAQECLDAGMDPASPEGQALADEIARASAPVGLDGDDRAFRQDLADRIASGGDARAERYWQLLGIMNGWAPIPTQQAAVAWMLAALRCGS